jgi:hypothetical protein
MQLSNHIGSQINNPIGGSQQSVNGHNLETAAGYAAVKDAMLHKRWRNRAHHIGGRLWQYTFLPYYPGLVTYCGLHDQQILTGWMSGCYIFRYVHKGKRHVAHVGTHETDTMKSDTAKSLWKAFADSADVSDVWGFTPLSTVSDAMIADAYSKGINLKIAGLWEPNGIMRTVVFGVQGNNADRVTLMGVINPGLQQWSTIRNNPKFAGV